MSVISSPEPKAHECRQTYSIVRHPASVRYNSENGKLAISAVSMVKFGFFHFCAHISISGERVQGRQTSDFSCCGNAN